MCIRSNDRVYTSDPHAIFCSGTKGFAVVENYVLGVCFRQTFCRDVLTHTVSEQGAEVHTGGSTLCL